MYYPTYIPISTNPCNPGLAYLSSADYKCGTTLNNTSLGAAGLLPSIIINSGYNSSISNSEFEFNSFLL